MKNTFEIGDNVIIVHDKNSAYNKEFDHLPRVGDGEKLPDDGQGRMHGSIPECPQEGVIINIGKSRALVEYVVGKNTMRLSFPLSALIHDENKPQQTVEREPIKDTSKTWGRTGTLLLQGVGIIKMLLELVLSEKITKEQKEKSKEEVRLFFIEVKKAFEEEKKREQEEKDKKEQEKKEGGKGDAQEEKKPEDNDSKGRNNSARDNEKNDRGRDEKESSSEMEQKDDNKGGVDIPEAEEDSEEKGEQEKDDIDDFLDGLEDEKEEEIEVKFIQGQSGQGKPIEISTGTTATIQGGKRAPPSNNGGKDKIYCGVCRKEHTRGTHD